MKRTPFLLPLLSILIFSFALSLQAKTFPMTSSSATPAASGKVEAKKDKNGNTLVTIKTEHLAEPGMLTPPATNYVVWFAEEGAQPMNEGQLKVAKSLKGEFKTTTHNQNFDVFITAESDPLVKSPSGESVLKTKVQNM